MRQKRITLFAGLAMLCTLALTALPAAAHPVTIGDGSRTDWFAKGAPEPNIGEIARDTSGRGEFVWNDAQGDQRTASAVGATGYITREVDLTRFNVTADTNNIYFLAKLDRYQGISNNPAVQLMISVDSNHSAGQTVLPDNAATNVNANAAWESVIETQFVPGASNSISVTAAPIVYTSNGTASTIGSAQLVSSAARQGGFAEITVPWIALGGRPGPQDYLRFTVSTYYSDHASRMINDGLTSRAMDVLSKQTTAAELADGTIDSYFDLHFNGSGEVFAPLIISEFLPDPPTSGDPKGEWIEIFNPNSFDVNLGGYKVGDQAYRGGSQGMVQLPSQLLLAGQTVLVVNDRATFLKNYPTLNLPATQIIDLITLPSYTEWASGRISLQNQNGGLPFRESLALLDTSDTIVDLVQYTTPTPATGLDPDNKPIVLTSTTVAANASYDRCPSVQDTNDSGIDFVVHTPTAANPIAGQTPGAACQGVPGVDLRISKNGPDNVDVAAGAQIQYVIPFSNAGTGPAAATSVVITDTLPVGLTCAQIATTPGVTLTGGSCPGTTSGTLTWSITSLVPGASGVITLTADVAPTLGQDIMLTNSVGIASTPSEAAATLHNNVATHTTITDGPPDITISSTWAQANGIRPNQQFSYDITYGNFGEDDATDVVIIDTVPAGVTVISAPGAAITAGANGTTTLTWHVSSIGYLESTIVRVTAKVNPFVLSGTALQNTLVISSGSTDFAGPGARPNTETASITVGKNVLYMPIVRRVG